MMSEYLDNIEDKLFVLQQTDRDSDKIDKIVFILEQIVQYLKDKEQQQ